MKLSKYKSLYKEFSKTPLPKSVWDTPGYKEYINAFINDSECREWDMKQKIKSAGIRPKEFCCIYMAYYLMVDREEKKDGNTNYDSVITRNEKEDQYGLPIHDGGTSYIKIKYCPWCGKKL